MTFLEVKTALRLELWPFPTEAKTQIAVHDKYFIEGIMDLQKWDDCLKSRNTDHVAFADTSFQCGKTVWTLPNYGLIQRVFTLSSEDGACDPIIFSPAPLEKVEVLSGHKVAYHFKASSAENDRDTGRERVGLYSYYRGRMYLAPAVQSTEALFIEWDGIRYNWTDDIELDVSLWTPRVLKVLRDYVWWQHCHRFGDNQQEKLDTERTYNDGRADLMHDCRESTQRKKAEETNFQFLQPAAATTTEGEEEPVVPENALTDENGDPILDENDDFILV